MTTSNYHKSISNPLIREAREYAEANDLPEKAFQAYRSQVHAANRRGIAWQFTLEQWWLWWQAFDERHGCIRWDRRGRRKNQLLMARFHDIGPYSPENVYCGTASDNARDMGEHHDYSATWKEWHANNDCWLKGRRGEGHPKSRAVITEMGRFGSIALASEAAGITRAGGLNRVRSGRWTLV